MPFFYDEQIPVIDILHQGNPERTGRKAMGVDMLQDLGRLPEGFPPAGGLRPLDDDPLTGFVPALGSQRDLFHQGIAADFRDFLVQRPAPALFQLFDEPVHVSHRVIEQGGQRACGLDAMRVTAADRGELVPVPEHEPVIVAPGGMVVVEYLDRVEVGAQQPGRLRDPAFAQGMGPHEGCPWIAFSELSERVGARDRSVRAVDQHVPDIRVHLLCGQDHKGLVDPGLLLEILDL